MTTKPIFKFPENTSEYYDSWCKYCALYYSGFDNPVTAGLLDVFKDEQNFNDLENEWINLIYFGLNETNLSDDASGTAGLVARVLYEHIIKKEQTSVQNLEEFKYRTPLLSFRNLYNTLDNKQLCSFYSTKKVLELYKKPVSNNSALLYEALHTSFGRSSFVRTMFMDVLNNASSEDEKIKGLTSEAMLYALDYGYNYAHYIKDKKDETDKKIKRAHEPEIMRSMNTALLLNMDVYQELLPADQALEILISLYYHALESEISTQIDETIKLFESYFPEEYKKIETLRALGLDFIQIKDMIYSNTGNDASPISPTFN